VIRREGIYKVLKKAIIASGWALIKEWREEKCYVGGYSRYF
jgi:hypothetical protein